jgi:phosphocarrier protein
VTDDSAEASLGALLRTLPIANKRGLHARAAAKFVKLAGQFAAEVTVRKNGSEVSGRSIMGLMMLAAAPGAEIAVEALGPQAAEVIEALAQLVSSRFAEDE